MTNNEDTQEATPMHTQALTDPIDELIPPARPRWVRLVVGVVILSVVGVGASLWGFGFVYPKPECCGSGGGGAMMSLTEDGKAVTVTAFFFNSSGHDLRVSAATADLPGATVLGIAMLDGNHTFPISRTKPIPAVVGGTQDGQLVITFVPTTCHDDPPPWGKVTIRLDVLNGWWPSIGRTYTLPGAVVEAGQGKLSVYPPEGIDMSTLTTPLASACALLGR